MEIDVKHGAKYLEKTGCETESLERNHITLNNFIDYTGVLVSP